MSPGRWLAVGALVLAAAFAVQAGEYSTRQWLALRREQAQERALLVQLKREVDSLERLAKQIETDPETQERIAREVYGMLRPDEFSFILVEPEQP